MLNLTSDVLLFLLAVVAVALIGGIWPASATAVVGSLLLNYYFVPPLHTFSISERNNILALVAVRRRGCDGQPRRRPRRSPYQQAARAAAEAETLFTLAGSVLRGQVGAAGAARAGPDDVRMTSATLLERGATEPPTGVAGEHRR